MVNVGRPWAIAAAFTVGREQAIPAMFRAVIRQLPQLNALGPLLAYLDRHVAIDSEEHGPLATKLLDRLCGGDDQRRCEATAAAVTALQARIRLWDAVAGRSTGRCSHDAQTRGWTSWRARRGHSTREVAALRRHALRAGRPYQRASGECHARCHNPWSRTWYRALASEKPVRSNIVVGGLIL